MFCQLIVDLQEMQFIKPERARARFGEYIRRFDGFTVLVYDSSQFMDVSLLSFSVTMPEVDATSLALLSLVGRDCVRFMARLLQARCT